MPLASNPPLVSSEPQFIYKEVMIMPTSRDCWEAEIIHREHLASGYPPYLSLLSP